MTGCGFPVLPGRAAGKLDLSGITSLPSRNQEGRARAEEYGLGKRVENAVIGACGAGWGLDLSGRGGPLPEFRECLTTDHCGVHLTRR